MRTIPSNYLVACLSNFIGQEFDVSLAGVIIKRGKSQHANRAKLTFSNC